MKWMGCLNHDLPYSINRTPCNPELARPHREEREKNRWCFTNHSPPTLRYRHHHDGRMRIRQHERWCSLSPSVRMVRSVGYGTIRRLRRRLSFIPSVTTIMTTIRQFSTYPLCRDTHYCSLENRGDGPCWLPLYLYSKTIDITIAARVLPLANLCVKTQGIGRQHRGRYQAATIISIKGVMTWYNNTSDHNQYKSRRVRSRPISIEEGTITTKINQGEYDH